MMLVSLNGADSAVDANVGGKAASLARLYKIPLLKDHAPVSFALTTEFFRSWIEELAQISEYVECQDDDTSSERLDMLCSKLKEKCKTIRLNESQEQALKELSTKIDQQFKHGLQLSDQALLEKMVLTIVLQASLKLNWECGLRNWRMQYVNALPANLMQEYCVTNHYKNTQVKLDLQWL